MMIPTPEPDPDSRQCARDAVAGCVDLPVRGCGELRLARGREDAYVVAARRLRTAPPTQLELVWAREGPAPEVVWGSLPERAKEAVLVVLARLIDAGAVAEES